MRVAALSFLAVVVFSCGGGANGGAGGGGGSGGGGGGVIKPMPGLECTGDAVCTDDPKSSLFCELNPSFPAGPSKLFVQYSCKGANGCTSNSSTVVCDFTGATPGDACPVLERDRGVCRADAGSLLKCADAGWREIACPNTSCRVQGTSVLCN
jgi:hypothetical protein